MCSELHEYIQQLGIGEKGAQGHGFTVCIHFWAWNIFLSFKELYLTSLTCWRSSWRAAPDETRLTSSKEMSPVHVSLPVVSRKWQAVQDPRISCSIVLIPHPRAGEGTCRELTPLLRRSALWEQTEGKWSRGDWKDGSRALLTPQPVPVLRLCCWERCWPLSSGARSAPAVTPALLGNSVVPGVFWALTQLCLHLSYQQLAPGSAAALPAIPGSR